MNNVISINTGLNDSYNPFLIGGLQAASFRSENMPKRKVGGIKLRPSNEVGICFEGGSALDLFPDAINSYFSYIKFEDFISDDLKRAKIKSLRNEYKYYNVFLTYDVVMNRSYNKSLYEEIKDKIKGYSQLSSDEDFEAPSEKTISEAIYFVEHVIEKQDVIPQLVRPVSDGEINFFWENDNLVFDVAIYGDGNYYYYFESKREGVKYSSEKELDVALSYNELQLLKSTR